jgi:hypothetical protein
VRRKIKQYEDEPETVDLTIGSFDSFTAIPANDKKVKPQIGFVRQKMAKPTYKPKPRPKK